MTTTRPSCSSSALNEELGAADLTGELAAALGRGEVWAADVLGGCATDAATAILQARLDQDPPDPAALFGLCVRHLARKDSRLADFVVAHFGDLDPFGGLPWVAGVMVLAPGGDLLPILRKLVAADVVGRRSVLSMLRGQIPADQWNRLAGGLGSGE